MKFSAAWLVTGLFIILSAIANGTAVAQTAAGTTAAVIPAYERFREQRQSEVEAGRLLISELNCHSCHGPLADDIIPPREAPVLTGVGDRVSAEYLRQFLSNPQSVRPGTTMPGIAALHADSASGQTVEALISFLKQESAFRHSATGADAVRRGESLFRRIGCLACHGDPVQPAEQQPPFVMHLKKFEQKYSLTSLTAFLSDPHAVRPSARMPSMNLTAEECRDVASFLLRDVDIEPNIHFEYYEGNWEQLPDFDSLTPVSAGGTTDFSTEVAARRDAFALRFTGFLHVPRDAEYRFWLSSDDGSRLIINGQTIIDHDGVHATSTKSGTHVLTVGAHELQLLYFENYGEESLTLEIRGGGLSRQPAAGLMSRTREQAAEPDTSESVDPSLAIRGRQLFAELGCAACHQHGTDEQRIRWSGTAPTFAGMKSSGGCLSPTSGTAVPAFALTDRQRQDIRAAITAGANSAETKSADGARRDSGTPAADIDRVLLTWNCYACHQRSQQGGVPEELNELFIGTIPEMGDEGRIPPHLDGIGDKLNPQWLRHLLTDGARDRPYMATRMPRFGAVVADLLVDRLVTVDQGAEVDSIAFPEPPHRVKAEARLMVGDQALSCIKCHSFDPFKATGIQAMDLTTMTRRLRRDWFHRYLMNPQEYRPGTRMPAAWPNGRSVVPKILGGDPATQIEAIWVYLEDGKQAKVPSGLESRQIELKPVDHPIIYRNFLEGLSPRAIAVGYPEQAHLAYDAEQMTVRLIWHGAFIDASKHWEGRGPGNQTPLGDHVLQLPSGPPLAMLPAVDAAWPTVSARESGFQFLGYRMNAQQQPAFQYRWQGIHAVDLMQPQTGSRDTGFLRTLTLTQSDAALQSGTAGQLWFRAAAGQTIEQRDEEWLIDESISLSFPNVRPVRRTVSGQTELLVPVVFDQPGQCVIQYSIDW